MTNKNKFKNYMRIQLENKLENEDIRGLITVLRKTIPNIFNPVKEGAVVLYRSSGDKNIYDFKTARNVTEAEAEVVLDLINEWTEGDYLMEITTSESYCLSEDEPESDITAMKHNQWVQKQVNEGWRYGLIFNENLKTDPRLRPYHELTDKLKNM